MARRGEGWRTMPATRAGSRGVTVVAALRGAPASNARALARRLARAARDADLLLELVLVADWGPPRARDAVRELRGEGLRVRLLEREAGAPGGRGAAIVLGLDRASHDTMVVMRADLRHEPESMPLVAAPILERVADLSLGSRSAAKLEDWPFHRKVVSWAATAAALPLTACADPTSGFFAISRATYLRGRPRLDPLCDRLGLELLVRCRCRLVQEVPIRLCERPAASERAIPRAMRFLRQLARLYALRACEHLGLQEWWPAAHTAPTPLPPPVEYLPAAAIKEADQGAGRCQRHRPAG